MKEPENSYHISFFKPTTVQARFNRNLVIWLASIWFIAIFGFQIALRVLEKPTPEPPYFEFTSTWESVKAGTETDEELGAFGASLLAVLSKVAIEESERSLLAKTMSWSFFKLLPAERTNVMVEEVAALEKIKKGITDIRDASYRNAKNDIIEEARAVFSLDKNDPRTMILPIEITLQYPEKLPDQAKSQLPVIMKKYLIHNQSVLTNTRLLGFPFHYFYTAIFLLVLFVGLCWLYCVRSDRRNEILGIED